MHRPSQVQTHHLEKLAVILIGSGVVSDYSHSVPGISDRAQRWGWSEARIVTIEDDSGVIGPRPGHGQEYRRLLELMRRGDVAIVFVPHASHLSRNLLNAEEFLLTAIMRGILLDVGGKLLSPRDVPLRELLNLCFNQLSDCCLRYGRTPDGSSYFPLRLRKPRG